MESFNGKFRDECLSLEWFRSRAEAKVIIEAWAAALSCGLYYVYYIEASHENCQRASSESRIFRVAFARRER